MSFKKFLAPVMSCFCAASSLVSCCNAYSYSDLYAVKVTKNVGSNFYDQNKKLRPGLSTIIYVPKSNFKLAEDNHYILCGKCGASVLFPEAYVVGHKSFFGLDFEGEYGELDDKVESNDRIRKANQELNNQLEHLVCKTCMENTINNAPKNEENCVENSNKYTQCPCCKAKSFQISSFSNLGEAKKPDHPTVKMLKFVVPFTFVSSTPVVVYLALASGDDENNSEKNKMGKKYELTIKYTDDEGKERVEEYELYD